MQPADPQLPSHHFSPENPPLPRKLTPHSRGKSSHLRKTLERCPLLRCYRRGPPPAPAQETPASTCKGAPVCVKKCPSPGPLAPRGRPKAGPKPGWRRAGREGPGLRAGQLLRSRIGTRTFPWEETLEAARRGGGGGGGGEGGGGRRRKKKKEEKEEEEEGEL